MNGNRALLDSNVLIFISKGVLDLKSLRSKYQKFYASIITYIEVYAFDFSDETERDLLDRVFKTIEIIDLSSEVAKETVNYRKSGTKKIKLPDAIILASAKSIGADLITDNRHDFQHIDAAVNILSIDVFKT
jgi:predicted nucleic acid-binding protein